MRLSRRDFFKLGSAAGLAGAVGLPKSLSAQNFEMGGRGFSHTTGKELKAIPSACWGCVTRDGIIGYVEDGRLKKIEGNPELPRTNGKLCARGQAGVNIVYNPDRLLSPLVRAGKRGEGKWKKISWDQALDLLVNGGMIAGRQVKGLKTLRDDGNAHHFMFHYGRMKGSDSKIIKSYFLPAYGTKTIGNHTSICESAKWLAHELTWGSHYDAWDLDNTKFILNFGCSVLEAHTNHVPMAQRCVKALARGVKMYTFDVRLSNTAAKSTEWIPIRPGTDLAVVLAMANVVMQNDLYDKAFIDTYTNVAVGELKQHLAQYAPRWVEEISGVPAAKIESVALEYARTKPSVCLSFRGAICHYNGVQTERAIQMLEAIAGNIDVPGGRCRAVRAKWHYPFPTPKGTPKKLHILDGEEGAYAYPTHHVSHQVLHMIDRGPERPEIYMIHCYNPAYVNGDCQKNVDVLKDEEKIPFLVAVDVALSESSELADLVLPDATYLERWSCEDMVCPSQVREFYIRQPMHAPLGEARNLCDVVCDLARRMGFDLGFSSAEEFVKAACDSTPGVKEAGGFEYMRQHGAMYDKKAKPMYRSHAKEVDLAGATLDAATGVYYEKAEGDVDYSSLDGEHAARQYVAQRCGDGKARKGFPPDSRRWKTGLLEIKSQALAEKGFDALPSWMPIPEHEKKGADELVLTTYKVNVQTHSRSQSSKWLTELYHRNPAWINPATAAARGVADGDAITVTSAVGSINTTARITEGIHPDVIAISNHCGHWAYGEYASLEETHSHVCEPNCQQIWWNENGVHPNWIIPNAGDPISGGQRSMDTVVKVKKA
jgi:anaerobic selenocysteine-containing dehydrogenase